MKEIKEIKLSPEESMWDWLTYDLRFLCKKYGLSVVEFGRLVSRSPSNASNILAGRRGIGETEAKTIDARYNTGGHFERLLLWARRGHSPDWFGQYVGIETTASVIKTYEALAIPGLLQTPEYARAILVAGGATNVDELLEKRMARQEVLDRADPPTLWAVLSQNAIDWPVGGPEAMRKQLLHLIEAASSPRVGLRVIPRAGGEHAGTDGSFSLISGKDGDVVYVEALGGGRLVVSSSEVRSYGLWYDRIGQSALPEPQSLELVRKVAEELR